MWDDFSLYYLNSDYYLKNFKIRMIITITGRNLRTAIGTAKRQREF